MESTKVALVIPGTLAPKWFHELLQKLEFSDFESKIYQLNLISSDMGYSAKHKWLHRLFGYSSVDYLEGTDLDSKSVSDVSELQINEDRNSKLQVLDFTASQEIQKFCKANENITLWTFSTLAWCANDKDISYKSWNDQKAGSIIEFYQEVLGVRMHIDSILSPGGQVSLFDYRRVYAAFSGRLVQWLGGRTIANSGLITYSDIQSRGSYLGNALSELKRNVWGKIRKSVWVLLYKNTGSSEWQVIKAEEGKELADPFVHRRDGATFVFAEEIDASGLGSIVAFPLQDSNSRKLVIDKLFHMSYPFLIEEGIELYMIPEASESNALSLYRCVRYPYEWEFVTDILTDIQIVDATIVRWNGKLWMFGNTKEFSATYNEELSIFHADKLKGPWTPHACNPIYIDSRYSRPAGALRTEGDKLFRYVQDCSWTYGERMHIMVIDSLTESTYSESWVEQLDLNLSKVFSANHTYNQSIDNGIIVTDAYN